jgi:RNA polymerase sigma factor (sigma-70 family)
MAKKSLNGVLHHVRLLAAVQTDRALADPDLLKRFVELNDEAAFTVLAERHGPMVLGVCQRALQHQQDAEDACQATFLVFARKAGSIRKSTALGSWLHGIACRIAANLKRQKARRHKREQRAAAPAVQPAAVNWHEVQTALDEELQQLPDRYRAPLLLCYWEGKTRDEAADQLGLSAGKLHGLLERGRDLLRDRLTQRGLTLSAALCASLLAAGTSAALSPTLVVSATKAALLVAAGQTLTPGLVSSQVLTLTKEVLTSMFFTKLKFVSASILCVGLAVALIAGSFATTGSAQDAAPKKAATATPGPKGESDEAFIRRLSKDLRGTDPTPAEIHFFVTNKDAGKRQKLVDLFIQERQAKQKAAELELTNQSSDGILILGGGRLRITQAKDDQELFGLAGDKKTKPDTKVDPLEAKRLQLEIELKRLQNELHDLKKKADDKKHADEEVAKAQSGTERGVRLQMQLARMQPPSVVALQNTFFKSLVKAADDKKTVPGVIQDYRDSLLRYMKEHPKAGDVPDAMLQIELTYRAQGKNVEADAWSAKLKKEHPNSPAAKQRLSALENRGPGATISEIHLNSDDAVIFFLKGIQKIDPQPKP